VSSIDWDDLRKTADEGTRPIPEGIYDVEVESTTPTTSSTGKPMIKITYRVVSGPHATRQIFTQIVLSPDSAFALAIFFRQMDALGLTSDFFATKPSIEQVAEAMRLRRVQIEVGIRPFQGVDRNEVKNIIGAQTGPLAGMPMPTGGPGNFGPPLPGSGTTPGGPPAPVIPTTPSSSTLPPTPVSPVTGEAPPTPAF